MMRIIFPHERPIAWTDVKTLRRSVASAFAYTMAYLMKLLMRQAMFLSNEGVGGWLHLNHHPKKKGR